MNFIVLGTTEFTLSCAKAILDSHFKISALISMPKYLLPLNSVNIFNFAEKHKIPYHEIVDINARSAVNLLKQYSPDFIFSSWPKIIKKKVLSIPKGHVIGTHPTNLPYNRGRHPLHWLIALGITKTKLSFFAMDKGVDSGRILLQVPFKIKSNDTITDLVSRMNKIAYEGTLKLCKKIINNNYYRGVKQNNKIANCWRKRTPHDITIDLRMSSDAIIRLVKSFVAPYPCANLIIGNKILKILNASQAITNISKDKLKRIEPGKVIFIKGSRIRVKTDDKLLDLRCKDSIPPSIKKVKYIHPPSKYFAEFKYLCTKF